MSNPQAIIALAGDPTTMVAPEAANEDIVSHSLREAKLAGNIYVLAKPPVANELKRRNYSSVIEIAADDIAAFNAIRDFLRERGFDRVLLVACEGALRPWREQLERKNIAVLCEFATSRGYK